MTRTGMFALAMAACQIVAVPSVAQEDSGAESTLSCRYATECYEEEPCTFTLYAHDLTVSETRPGEARLDLETGPARGSVQTLGDGLVVTATDSNAAYQLTRDAAGFARLSVHFAAPLQVITYHGACLAAE